MSIDMRLALRVMASRNSMAYSGSSMAPSASASALACKMATGVRSSWLTLATKSLRTRSRRRTSV